MANLAIKGHLTRGEEVIRILEMLGGVNKTEYNGDQEFAYYFINNNYIDWCHECIPESNFICFTLEEFLEEFPYKVGDKVNYVKYNDEYPDVYTIQKMRWVGTTIEYLLDSSGFSALTKDLQPYQPYKGEIKIEIPAGYEFVGVDDNAQQVIFRKIRPQYPKTYKECCEVLVGRKPNPNEISFDKMELCLVDLDNTQNIDFQTPQLLQLNNLFKLLMCRNAYWKIAGEQMGLDKPWEPDWTNPSEIKYCITNTEGNIAAKWAQTITNKILAFPTVEIRDAFKENFDDDIEFCKEFL